MRVHLTLRGKVFWARFTDKGQRRALSLKTHDRRLAEKAVAKIEGDLFAGHFKLPSSVTVEEFLPEYLQDAETRLRRKSYHGVRNTVTRFSQETPVRHLAEVTTALVGTHLKRLRESGNGPKTANNVRAVLHAMFSYAVKNGHVPENPVSRVSRYAELRPLPRFLEKSDIKKALETLEGSPLSPLVFTAIYAGLRRTELCWLTWDDIDLTHKTIRVRGKKVGEDEWFPKTGRDRGVTMSKKIIRTLKEHKASANGSTWVFTSPQGCRWNPDNLTHRLENELRKAGLPWTFLDFRHTFGTALARKGVSSFKIAKLMGNSSAIVERHYAALVPEDMRADVEF